MNVFGVLVGTVSLALVVFKTHLFVKLRHKDRLLPGYRGPSGFFAVFAYGTKGNHVKPSESQTLVAMGGAGELSASLIAGDGLNIQDAGGITVAFDVDQKNDQDGIVTTAAAAAEE